MANYREPWELTKRQYMAFREEGITDQIWRIKTSGPGSWGKRKWRQRSVELHKDSILRAIERGRAVPSRVLRDYPDLRRRANRR